MSTTALNLITVAFNLLNVFQPEDPIPPQPAQMAFTILNGMMGTLRLSSQATPVNVREVFPLVAGQGGPVDPTVPGSGPYTIGPNGNFNTTRPQSVAKITNVSVLLGGTIPSVEVKRAMFSYDSYNAVAIKELQNQIFTAAYYNPTYTGGLGSIYLYPVPNTNLNSFVLYRQLPMSSFVSLNASYDLPDGYDEMIWSNLALRLSDPFGRTPPAFVVQTAKDTLAMMKSTNLVPVDLPMDDMLTSIGVGHRRGSYNINTGEGG